MLNLDKGYTWETRNKTNKENREKDKDRDYPIFTESVADRDEEDYIDFIQKTSD